MRKMTKEERASAARSQRSKVALGAADRGDARANGARESTRASAKTREAAKRAPASSQGSGAANRRTRTGAPSRARRRDPGEQTTSVTGEPGKAMLHGRS